MSKIITNSLFFFGTTVTVNNRAIDFDEGGAEIQATLPVGDYSATEYAAAVAQAMTDAGAQVYTGTFNRTTRALTISAPGTFKLRSLTGTRFTTTAYPMMGFSILADYSGTNTYAGANLMGSAYRTQYPVNAYVAVEDSVVKEQATLNQTASGVTQVISFGDGSRLQMNIRVITNKINLKNTPFYSNASGVANARTFVSYLLTKAKVEFMPNYLDPGTFTKCLLESTPEDKNGLKFQLKNMGTPDFYQTGVLTFRKVD